MSRRQPMSAGDARTPLLGWLRGRVRRSMRQGEILLASPVTAFQAPGGGEVQLARTARHLAALGVAAKPFCPWSDRIEKAGALHLFGMAPEGIALARAARAAGVPVVLSPILWYEPRALWHLERGAFGRVKALGGYALRRACPIWPSWRRRLLRLADRVLPNSGAEAQQLVRLFGIDRKRITVVPNGVEAGLVHAEPGPFRSWAGVGHPFVLYAGRVEPRKNVLGLAQSCRRLDFPLVVIGDPPPGRAAYARACREAAGPRATWLRQLEPDDARLASAFAAARVFALPSWFETPGLSALEAGLAGVAVVVTPHGCTREYFGHHVDYARPGRPAELDNALRRAWERGPRRDLARRIESRYLWNHVAKATAEVYAHLAR